MSDNGKKEVFETPDEKAERCDVFVDFGPLERGMWLTKEAVKRSGKDKPTPEELIEAKRGITPEERHQIYVKGIVDAGKTEEQALEILKDEACRGSLADPWCEWYVQKLVAEGKLDEGEWGKK